MEQICSLLQNLLLNWVYWCHSLRKAEKPKTSDGHQPWGNTHTHTQQSAPHINNWHEQTSLTLFWPSNQPISVFFIFSMFSSLLSDLPHVNSFAVWLMRSNRTKIPPHFIHLNQLPLWCHSVTQQEHDWTKTRQGHAVAMFYYSLKSFTVSAYAHVCVSPCFCFFVCVYSAYALHV